MAYEYHIDEAGYRELTQSPTGAVWKYMDKLGKDAQKAARRFAPKRTRALERSITSRVELRSGAPAVIVGSDLPYALIAEVGSRPHLIYPNNGRYLRFVVRGRVVYARVVKHPGTKGAHYLTRAVDAVVPGS